MFENILIAYNNIQTRSIFYETFSNLGYKTSTVSTHKDILEILKKERPDFIILDTEISDIPAKEAEETIKAIDNNIEVIIADPDKESPQAIIKNILKVLREGRPLLAAPKKNKGLQVKANILIIDDEAECSAVVENYLSKKGYTVQMACSGEEAMLKIGTFKPDIVLLDIRMSGVDGLIILKKIKEIDKSLIVIMTSAVSAQNTVKEALRLGADGYLIKPFNLEKLESIIFDNALKK